MARGKTIHFLLTYDRSERRLVNMERFHNGRKAVDASGEREREFADRPHTEVVLLGADSERAIRVTHPIYFEEDLCQGLVAAVGEVAEEDGVDRHVVGLCEELGDQGGERRRGEVGVVGHRRGVRAERQPRDDAAVVIPPKTHSVRNGPHPMTFRKPV